ncbi:MAG TPA: DUF5069 domain-containing protein [Candidatus Aquilonibacter sp.]|nr:DUF5069 domain-containing protein [Candidatus Aquilonibacter sp.]
MEALNLTQRPPRKTTDVLGGVIFMARTVDKLRATLPGGDVGAYQIQGFSSRMLEMLAIDEEDLRSLVALAQTDDEIAQWVLKHTTQEARDAWNSWINAQTLRERLDRPGFFDRYPVARDLPPDTTMIEMLNYDDTATFA